MIRTGGIARVFRLAVLRRPILLMYGALAKWLVGT